MARHLEIHLDERWVRAATLEPFGDGVRVDYLDDYVFRDTPVPVSMTRPVAFSPPGQAAKGTPAFLFDLVPQGHGRQLLLQLLDLRDSDHLLLPLIEAGAFSPVGQLRVDTAVAFYDDYVRRNPPPPGGFTLQALANRDLHAVEHLATHAMLTAGSPGVQGIAPKYLLAEDATGQLYAELALSDLQVRAHWLAKGPRSRSAVDQTVLRNEAAYLQVAAACGLRVYRAETIRLEGGLLLMPRFDRRVAPVGVQRLAQESLASLAGLTGFGQPVRLNTLLRALRRHVSDPRTETIEFLQRDVLNQAMRNTDNHARNHAVQRLPGGCVQLTPLYDFAPMFMDPELIPRVAQWADAADVRLDDWAHILAALDLRDDERAPVTRAMHDFAARVAALPLTMRDAGVDAAIIEQCRASIDRQADQLARLIP